MLHPASQSAPTHAVTTDALLDGMQWQADPLADETIAAIIGPWPATPPGSDAKQWSQIACVNRLFDQWTSNGTLADWQPHEPVPENVAAPLQAYVQSGRTLPDWADPARIQHAERLFMDHVSLSCMVLFCSSLPECYMVPDLASVLHAAGQLEQHTEHRIRTTAAMIFPVMMRGGLTHPDGTGVAQVLKVRLIHATIRNLILRGAPPKQAAYTAVRPMPHPSQPKTAGLHEALFCRGWNAQRNGLPCNQEELAYTLLAFGYVFLRSMRRLSIALKPAEENAYLHTWNVIGHMLGIDRSLMADTMDECAALMERMQVRGRAHMQPPDARPALARGLITTMQQALPWKVIRPFPEMMTRYLCGRACAHDLGLTTRPPLVSWGLFWLTIGAARAIDALIHFICPNFSIVMFLARMRANRLTAKILMDQTRPLRLPTHLLQQMGMKVKHRSDSAQVPH